MPTSNKAIQKEMTEHFFSACATGDLEKVLRLTESMEDIDIVEESGKTGLMLAAARNHIDIMRFLLRRNADPNRTNLNGTTALMFAKTAAFAYGDCTGMQLLIDAGADRNAKDKLGLTALDYTIMRAALVRSFLEEYRPA